MSVRIDPPTPRASLLGLPWELREQIYQNYFKVDGGYVYDGDSDQLVEANGQPVDISLRYTCHSIEDETKHFPFSLNAITFSTIYRPDWRKQAGYLGYILAYEKALQRDIIFRLRRSVTPDMYTQLALKFPRHEQHIREDINFKLSNDERYPNEVYSEFQNTLRYRENLYWEPGAIVRGGWNEETVSCRRAIAHMIRLIAEKHPTAFAEALDEVLPGWSESYEPHEFFDPSFDPWAIPSLSEITAVLEKLQIPEHCHNFTGWYQRSERFLDYKGPTYRYRRRYCFSAAAVAIRFLGQLSQDERLYIRKLVIDEDEPASA
ncbi:hypothetical protein NW762_010748 [Fusarium torreyae]|uniref:Uncharacterized protein n=1 Tax=Fusarium torreyae TaxID=1237075 RepID=A0A9W8V9Z5_9HYPO|nr:hypothetical protein NW762_010748 [Fusarium torreyae]